MCEHIGNPNVAFIGIEKEAVLVDLQPPLQFFVVGLDFIPNRLRDLDGPSVGLMNKPIPVLGYAVRRVVVPVGRDEHVGVEKKHGSPHGNPEPVEVLGVHTKNPGCPRVGERAGIDRTQNNTNQRVS
jgi:hypothetical protein